MPDSNKIPANPGVRRPAPADGPLSPAWYPPPAGATRPTPPTTRDPRLAAAPPIHSEYPHAAGPPALPAARAPMTPDRYRKPSASGDPSPYGSSARTDRSRHLDDEVEDDLPEDPRSDDMICQAELEELAALDSQRNEIDAKRKARRNSILDRLENGCVVQPGRYDVKRTESRSCHLTLGNLEDVLGEDFVKQLREDLPVRTYFSLKIRERKASQSRADRAPAGSRAGEIAIGVDRRVPSDRPGVAADRRTSRNTS